ncbi:MAG: nucleotide exchange factor GrpE [Candidatus Binataceae bacterium]
MSKRDKDDVDVNKNEGTITLTPESEVTEGSEREFAQGDNPSAEIESLRTQIAEKDKQITDWKDKYLRSLADSENSRKRIRQQSDESVRVQREALVRDLLPIVDNLERAVSAARGGGNGKSIVDGIEMVLGSLLDFLRIQGITRIDTVGQPFDPRLHEAVDHVESEHHRPNTVIEEFHRGYASGDRILRPARVSVAKAAEKPTDKIPEEE